ncbi:MAG TPA: hypothetical protein VK633_05120 [Verrucomicrobiae bacterium]|nr:hypothetical protein [Verrucomicrobiae bacterium]
MKSKMAIVWFMVSLTLGAILVFQSIRGARRQTKLETLQLQVEKVTQQSRKAEAEAQELRQEQARLQGDLASTETALQQANSSPTTSAAAKASPAPASPRVSPANGEGTEGSGKNLFADLLKDPEMRKAMAQQQRMGLDMIYGSLFKELQLTPEQEKNFKDVLLEQQMANISQAGAMLGDAKGDKAEIAKKLGEEHRAREGQLKEILGEEKFAQYQEYNQTVGERMMLDQFGKQAEISPDQNEQLLAIMREEKKNIQINQGTPAFDPNQDFQSIIQSPDAAEKLFSQQEQVNARVLERAGQVLTPEQMQKFEPIMKNQLNMQKAGLKMARQMFGGKSEEPAK